MKAQRLAIYEALGIASIPEQPLDVTADDGTHITVMTGASLGEQRRWLAEQEVARLSVFSEFIPLGVNAESIFSSRVEEASQRISISPDAVYLVINATNEVAAQALTANRWFGEVAITFNGVADEELIKRAKTAFQVVSSAWALIAMDGWSIDFRTVREISFVTDDFGRRIHPLSVRASVSSRVLGGVSEEMLDRIRLSIAQLDGRVDLNTVSRLLAQALRSETHRLQAFMSAWTALEIFVAKTFPRFEELFLQSLSEGQASRDVLKRIQEVMSDKYRLTDKFSLLASHLAPEDAERDTRDFGTFKKKRDKYFHEMESDVNQLPLGEVITLLRKYLRLYLQFSSGVPRR